MFLPPIRSPSIGATPRWLPDRHQDCTMRAHDFPVIETPDLLLAVLERASDGVVIVDSDLHVSHFNAAAEVLWQLDRAEVLGHHVSRLGLTDIELEDLEQQRCCDGGLGSAERQRRHAAIWSRDQDPAQGRQPDPCRAVGRARRGRRSKPHRRLRSGHHRRGRITRETGVAHVDRRPDQPWQWSSPITI